jgi:hypothetical protein
MEAGDRTAHGYKVHTKKMQPLIIMCAACTTFGHVQADWSVIGLDASVQSSFGKDAHDTETSCGR